MAVGINVSPANLNSLAKKRHGIEVLEYQGVKEESVLIIIPQRLALQGTQHPSSLVPPSSYFHPGSYFQAPRTHSSFVIRHSSFQSPCGSYFQAPTTPSFLVLRSSYFHPRFALPSTKHPFLLRPSSSHSPCLSSFQTPPPPSPPVLLS